MTKRSVSRLTKRTGGRDLDRLQRAFLAHSEGNLTEAEKLYRSLLASNPNHHDALHLLGVILDQLGRPLEAERLIGRALKLNPANAAAHSNRGLALHALGRFDDALAAFDAAIALKPDYAEALYNAGNSLNSLGRAEDALASYDKALTINPDYPEALMNRGALLHKMRRPQEALGCYDKLLVLRPNTIEALNNRGNVLQDLMRLDEAIEAFDRVLAIDPGYANAMANHGNVLMRRNRMPEASTWFRRAIDTDPTNAAAHWGEALSRLIRGEFADGWKEYEWRWKCNPRRPARDFAKPLWLGVEDISGRTILLHAEQGLGDTIQFCRYAELVGGKGARVVLAVQPSLKSLLADLPGVDAVLGLDEPLPDFDVHCPLLSLPLAFGTTVTDIPAKIPYLQPSARLVEKWRTRLGPSHAPMIGLAWSGNPEHENDVNRSMPLAALGPLCSTEARFVSLQKDLRPADHEVLRQTGSVLHFGDQLEDFADTAALASLMDLVVSVDTSAAHLSGALGKPTWILLPFAGEWRWLLDRDDSPWYPTARLFRQPRIGDWASLVAQVVDDLHHAGRPVATDRLDRVPG